MEYSAQRGVHRMRGFRSLPDQAVRRDYRALAHFGGINLIFHEQNETMRAASHQVVQRPGATRWDPSGVRIAFQCSVMTKSSRVNPSGTV